ARGLTQASSAPNARLPNPDELKRVLTHYAGVRALFINGWLYSLIADWLDGRQLLPKEVADLEGLPASGLVPTSGLAYELATWTDAQSIDALWDQSRSGNNLLAASWIKVIAEAYDTLAMRELVLGVVRNDMGKDRCARSLAFLARARRLLFK